MQKNVIKHNNLNLQIADDERPFGNDFRVLSVKESWHEGQPELHAVVECLPGSPEPGCQYACYYSAAGVLAACCTLT